MAYTMKCNGTDTAGNSVYLIGDSNSQAVNINGDILTIVGKTRNNQGVVTQNFITVSGVLVYDSLVPVNNTNLTIYQFNAVTQALLAQVFMSCNFYGNFVVTPSVMDNQMFDSIKADTLKSTGGMPFNNAKEPEGVAVGSIDSCIAKVDEAINASINRASSAGLLCSSSDLANRMKIAMTKGNCYGEKDQSKLCQIKIDAMVASAKGCTFSDAMLKSMAKSISGC